MIRSFLGAATAAFAALLVLSSAGCGGGHHMLTAPRVAGSPSESNGSQPDALALDDAGPGDARALPIDAPGTISAPGDYRLTRDLTVTSGDGLVITASDVRLRLGGHTLTGPGDKSGRAIVIDGASDVLVSGGLIRRFGIGIAGLEAQRCRVRGVTIEGGDETADPANGNPPQIGLMFVNSADNVVAGNRLRNVNLGLFIRGGGSRGNRLRNNLVVGGEHGLLGICYNPAPDGGAAGPHGDLVAGNLLARFGTGISASAGSERNRFVENTIRFFDSAWSDQNGSNVFERNRASQISR